MLNSVISQNFSAWSIEWRMSKLITDESPNTAHHVGRVGQVERTIRDEQLLAKMVLEQAANQLESARQRSL